MTVAERDAVIAALLPSARARGEWLRMPCPFCEERHGSSSRDATLGVHATSGGFRCFRCGLRGKMALPGDLTLLPPVRAPMNVDGGMRPPPGFVLFASDEGRTSLALTPAWEYLAGRGIAPGVLAEAGIGACASGSHAGRVVVPVFDLAGEKWLGFSARRWTKCAPHDKYRNAVGPWRGGCVYNAGALHVVTDEPCFVVEGVFDALAPALWPDAVALLGDATEAQIQILIRSRRPLVVVLDGDAHRKAWALATRLRFEGARAEYIRLAPQTDPDEVDAEWLRTTARALLAGET